MSKSFGCEETSSSHKANISLVDRNIFGSLNMTQHAWTIADLPHRSWKLKYLPDEFRAEDIKDESHPYFSLLQVFDTLRDTSYTTDDIPVLSILEPKLKQIGKIIDKLIDLPGPYAKGIFDFTALSAYVHTINDIWSKKNQLYLTPIWREPLGGAISDCFDGEIIEINFLTTLIQTSIILDWWLGKPQFDFWIGIIDLNFDTFPTQLEAYVHWYNAVFFPDYSGAKRTQPKEIEKDNSMSVDNEHSESSSDSEEEIDIMDHIDKEKEQPNKKMFMRIPHVTSSSDEWSGSDDF
ncbi:13837_t:CDS:2 [Funneliformis caledonium]|uniref:13837_t:CDS:1 n=1 Tax=Funneliformis caledonium TaxID=1117310 RepID=A0A9N8VMJ3_9GLOM|nr:13837_t:CDS:2 [Funneliformis caledonium]